MKYVIRLVLDDASEKKTLNGPDIERLEKVVEREQVVPARKELYVRYLTKLSTLNLLSPHLRALTLASSVDRDNFCLALRNKALLTAVKASPHVKVQLANILEKLSRAYLKRQTILGLLYGADLLNASQNLKGNVQGEHDAQRLVKFTRELIKKNNSTPIAIVLWPIEALRSVSVEQLVENEVGVYELLAGLRLPLDLYTAH
jgi:hypothetical protein